jgi:ureidoglycolate amidohydrolase
MNLRVDKERLVSQIDGLAEFSDAEPPAVTRVVFSAADLKARAWVKAKCAEAGLTVREDAVGNMFARWNGSDLSAAAVGTGSHIDAIPNAGKYDGVVGVLGGLEAIRTLQRSGFRPKHPIELLMFTSEEPTRFGIGCLGSRLLSGMMSAEASRKLADGKGASLEQIRREAGFAGELEDVRLPRGYHKAFVELHIEQGPILEREHIPLGVVSRIAAPASLGIVVEGEGGHAGGVLMPDRRDALCAAAELILETERAARTSGAIDTVATVGICDVFPGVVNSIPAKVRLSVDVRDTSLDRRNRVIRRIEEFCRTIESSRQLRIRTECLNADAPADCHPAVVDALTEACRKHELHFLPMTSRAYHDSLFMAYLAPVAMLFIPCRNGYSHRPDEYASPDDIAAGVLVLAETLAALAS